MKIPAVKRSLMSPSLCSWSKFTALRDVPLLEVLFSLFFVTNVILPFLHIILKDHYTIKYYWFWLQFHFTYIVTFVGLLVIFFAIVFLIVFLCKMGLVFVILHNLLIKIYKTKFSIKHKNYLDCSILWLSWAWGIHLEIIHFVVVRYCFFF